MPNSDADSYLQETLWGHRTAFPGWVRETHRRMLSAVSLEKYSQDTIPPYGASRDLASVQGRLCGRLKGHVGTSL